MMNQKTQFVQQTSSPLFSLYCEVKTPQFKNGLVDYFLFQTGWINPGTWLLKGDKHDINFRTEENFKQHLVRWL